MQNPPPKSPALNSDAAALARNKAIGGIKKQIELVCLGLKGLRHQPDEQRTRQLYQEFGKLMFALDEHVPPGKSIQIAVDIYNRILSS
jgi:hypothetical protein